MVSRLQKQHTQHKKTLVLKLNLSWITRNTLVLSQEGKGCLYYLLIYFYFIVNHLSIQCGIPPGSDFCHQSKDMHVRSLGVLKFSVGVNVSVCGWLSQGVPCVLPTDTPAPPRPCVG